MSACRCVGLSVCAEFSDWFVCMGQRGIGLEPSISQSLHKQSRYNEKDLCERERKLQRNCNHKCSNIFQIILQHNIIRLIHYTLRVRLRSILHITYITKRHSRVGELVVVECLRKDRENGWEGETVQVR